MIPASFRFVVFGMDRVRGGRREGARGVSRRAGGKGGKSGGVFRHGESGREAGRGGRWRKRETVMCRGGREAKPVGDVAGFISWAARFVAWHELGRPRLADSDVIVDITWGPHRRVARFGAPSKPRKLDSYIFQVVVAFDFLDNVRRFVPGSLRVQRVSSKDLLVAKAPSLALALPVLRGCDWVDVDSCLQRRSCAPVAWQETRW